MRQTGNFLIRIGLAILVPSLAAMSSSAQEAKSIYDYTLEELADLTISSGASLTRTKAGRQPASVTLITREMIEESGARGLDELLDIYVPNYQRIRHGASGPHFGIRGINSNLDNVALLLVNGREMNQKTEFGAISERYLPLLGDIESIEVVRGPGSAVYGAGAINGVIAIQTSNAVSFEGAELSVKQGFIEGFSLADLRIGRSRGTNSGVYLYYGLDRYRGADAKDSPLVFSKNGDFINAGGVYFLAGVPVDSGIVNDNRALDGRLHHKAHVDIRRGNTRAWMHYTRGSTHYLISRHRFERTGLENSKNGLMYQQFTVQAEQRVPLGKRLTLSLSAGYDVFDMVLDDPTARASRTNEYAIASREDQASSKALLSWSPNPEHAFAAGLQHSRDWFGKSLLGLSNDPPHDRDNALAPWTTDTYSLLAEYQWNAGTSWTAFLGGRADKHTFTPWMLSPKAALVYSPGGRHTTKWLYNESVRKSNETELKMQHDLDPAYKGDTETIRSLELRHDFSPTAHLKVAAAAFLYAHDLIGHLPAPVNRDAPLGQTRVAGVELESGYTSQDYHVRFSHAYTKLLDFTLVDESIDNQVTSSEPYGYGSNLTSWSPHVTKFYIRRILGKGLRANASLRVCWGFPGGESYTAYNNEVLKALNRSQSDGRTNAFDGSAFLNVGAIYDIRSSARLDIQLHNILGWIQPDLNKRNYYARMAGYRVEAPAVSMRVGYTF